MYVTTHSRGSSASPLTMATSELEDFQRQSGLIGEDAGVFSFKEQSLTSWGAFLAVLGTVLTALYFLWLNPDTGYGEVPCSVFGHMLLWGDGDWWEEYTLLLIGYCFCTLLRANARVWSALHDTCACLLDCSRLDG